MNVRIRATARAQRAARWLTLVGLTVLLAGLGWDVGLHYFDPEFATETGVALWEVPAHVVAAAGAMLTACGVALTQALRRASRQTRGTEVAIRLIQAMGVLGLVGVGLVLVVAGEQGRSVLHRWLLDATHPAEEPAIRLQYQLLRDPIDLRVLPAGLSLDDLRPHPLSGRLQTHRAVGGVNVFLQGSDLSDRIGYRVFPSAADAAGYFEPVDLDPGLTLISRSATADGVRPARCETYRYTAQGTDVTATDCLTLTDTVVVVGTVAQEGSGGPDQSERAYALARIGSEHVSRIAAQDR
jgi:hypothetical protein